MLFKITLKNLFSNNRLWTILSRPLYVLHYFQGHWLKTSPSYHLMAHYIDMLQCHYEVIYHLYNIIIRKIELVYTKVNGGTGKIVKFCTVPIKQGNSLIYFLLSEKWTVMIYNIIIKHYIWQFQNVLQCQLECPSPSHMSLHFQRWALAGFFSIFSYNE